MQDFLDVKFDQFIEDYNLGENSEETNWKRFVNYQFYSQFQPGRLDTDADLLDQICVESSEFSEVHGALFLLNDQILSEPQDVDDILQRDQKGLLELYFLTTGNTEILARQLEKLFYNLDVIEKDEKWMDILHYVMSRNIMLRWKDNPKLRVVIYSNEGGNDEWNFSDQFHNCFSEIDCIKIDKRRLRETVNSNENSYRGEIECNALLNIVGGKEELGNAFVICMSARELIGLMTNSDGLLRRNMFDDNVRDSQGQSAVNQEILATLREHPDRFALYNNGITIVCKSARQENRKFILENPQIVNGCQTCNMIYHAYRDNVNLDGVQIIAKIVGSNKEDVTQGIVRGANRQNIVYEEAFETIRGFHKNLERYFENNQVSGYQKIYYERRSRQYADNIQIKPQQKISFCGLIRSMVTLFLNHVEDSPRHEYPLLKKYKDNLFVDTHSCLPYYLAAFLYLNVDILFREKKLPKELSSFKMHIMLLIKEMKGGLSPDLGSDRIDQYCERLLASLKDGKLKECALEACEKFREIRIKWIRAKGVQYQFGIKDSAEFRNFLMKEVYGTLEEHNAEKIYTGYVMNVDLDRNHTFFGFIEHMPDNVFFHEFDNPDMDRTYIGKRVSYRIARSGGKERAIDVRLMGS